MVTVHRVSAAGVMYCQLLRSVVKHRVCAANLFPFNVANADQISGDCAAQGEH